MDSTEFKTIAFPGEETKYIYVDDEALNYLTALLAQQIVSNERNIDYLVPLAKGGWTVARSLFGYLHVSHLKLDKTATLGVGSYDGIGRKGEARMNQQFSQQQETEMKGKSVLVVDDLTDTGEQLTLVKSYLESLGVERVILAALFRKPRSTAALDYWVKETTHWIIFAYEALETMEELDQIWQNNGIDKEEIKRRFVEIGFGKQAIEHYWASRKRLEQTPA
ncbi:MAG: putative phosphoribosyltransferase [Candidatus Pacebacteria bacterium GW2011_GWB1_47_8]|nr:MAG: putative phosphoribosyltransferase [Candidatus Pacebacteria bacterium GW2011_GWA1_46_10]KKU84713.1 MAG: putative phosphoribosyltransferase [Candidatus Pacebacteria bacterium GW2011_GWB1_47_8]HCR81025.1 hypothetical protein [Candidatus Paceibacterota bacterium]